MNMENIWNMEVQTQSMTVILQWDIMKISWNISWNIIIFNPPVLIKHIPEKTMAHGFLGVRTSRKMPREQDDDFYWNLAFLSYTFNTNAT